MTIRALSNSVKDYSATLGSSVLRQAQVIIPHFGRNTAHLQVNDLLTCHRCLVVARTCRILKPRIPQSLRFPGDPVHSTTCR